MVSSMEIKFYYKLIEDGESHVRILDYAEVTGYQPELFFGIMAGLIVALIFWVALKGMV